MQHKDSSTATMLSNFEFGESYIWRYTGLHNGKQLGWHGPYNFKILLDIHVDKKLYRVKVLVNDSSVNERGLITLDNKRSIIDRAGNFVWYLPQDTNLHFSKELQSLPDNSVNDMRVTSSGTITVINHFKAEEMDLNGRVLWRAPHPVSKDGNEPNGAPYSYNHCFKKLDSGNYMVIDRGKITTTVPGSKDSAKIIRADETIREFDRNAKLTWSWNSSNYLDTTGIQDILKGKPEKNLLDPSLGGHMNAFYADEKNGFIYAGFRNVSRVVKIDKKTGAVVCSWGKGMTYNGQKNGDGFFSKQHESMLLRDGTIAVYNNDFGNSFATTSSVVIFTQPIDHENSKVCWQFDCNLDTANNISYRGGNVDEQKNGNLLVCMGTVNKVFEITRSKNLVWSAVIERLNTSNAIWQPCPLYRAHYASSLYPCYFTIQTNADTLHKSPTSFELRVFNDGTEDDSYLVSISSATGYYNKQFSTPSATSKKSMRFEIAPRKLPTKDDKIEIVVQSKTNPDFKRTLYVLYSK